MEPQDETLTCKECGEPVNAHKWMKPTGDMLTQRRLCYSCNHFAEFLPIANDPTTVRVKGEHFMIGDEDENPKWKGYGGRPFHIRFFDGREVATTNLGHLGEIPRHYQDRLPDNATKESVLRKLPSVAWSVAPGSTTKAATL